MDGAPYNREQMQIDAEKVLAEIERLQKYVNKFKKTFSDLFYNNAGNDENEQTMQKDADSSLIYNTIYNTNKRDDGANLNQITKKKKRAESEKYVETAKMLINKYFHTLSSFERERLMESQALKEASDAYAKLISLGYSHKLIEQAIQDARNDTFWSQQFRSLRKLTRKNKDGVLYVDIFLALKQNKHKLTVPKIIR